MMWNVSFLLFQFFLESLLLLSRVVAHTLSQAFFQFWALADVNKDGVAFLEITKSESFKADLNDSSVELNLNSYRLLCYNLGDSRFH